MKQNFACLINKDMTKPFFKATGISILIGCFLIIITMVLHPVGGSMDHLLQITPVIVGTHTIALCSLPFLFFGFFGLTSRLKDHNGIAILALVVIGFGLVAVMIAAALNGLILPIFLERNVESISEQKEVITLILSYNFSCNQAMDYIFISACCFSISIYSYLMIRTKNRFRWIGIFGLTLTIIAFIATLIDFTFTNVAGFQIVIFCLAAWMIWAGIILIKNTDEEK